MTSSAHISFENNRVTAGPGSDAKAFAVATLLTFASGMLVMFAYGLMGGFGLLLGIGGAIFGVVQWRKKHDDRLLPRDASTPSLVLLAVVAVGLLGLTALIA